jgi:hypothetical protein
LKISENQTNQKKKEIQKAVAKRVSPLRFQNFKGVIRNNLKCHKIRECCAIYITYTCTYIWTNGREIIPSTSWFFLTIQNVEPVAVVMFWRVRDLQETLRDFMLVIQKISMASRCWGFFQIQPPKQ